MKPLASSYFDRVGLQWTSVVLGIAWRAIDHQLHLRTASHLDDANVTIVATTIEQINDMLM